MLTFWGGGAAPTRCRGVADTGVQAVAAPLYVAVDVCGCTGLRPLRRGAIPQRDTPPPSASSVGEAEPRPWLMGGLGANQSSAVGSVKAVFPWYHRARIAKGGTVLTQAGADNSAGAHPVRALSPQWWACPEHVHRVRACCSPACQAPSVAGAVGSGWAAGAVGSGWAARRLGGVWDGRQPSDRRRQTAKENMAEEETVTLKAQ